MTTVTVTSGNHIVYTDNYIGGNNDTWADLGSSPVATWANWRYWNTDPSNLVVRIDDDLLSSEVRAPQLLLDYYGVISSITLKISDTGSFSGEETSYTLSTGTATTVIAGRYYRWTVTLAKLNDVAAELRTFSTFYSEVYRTEVFRSVSTSTLSGSITGRVVPTTLGTIHNVQLTTHNNFTWVDRAYALPDAWNETTIAPIASVVSKSPLTIVLRDDFGVAVDGTVDIFVYGAPQIQLTDQGVIII